MAKVKLNHMFISASGKLCKKEGTYVAYNKQTGKMYQAEYHERVQPNSAEQQAVKQTFTQKASFAGQWWRENKPATKDAKGTEAYQAVMKAYKSQSKIGNPYSFLRSLVTDDLKVMLGGKDLTGGIVPGQSGGGTSTDQGSDSGVLE